MSEPGDPPTVLRFSLASHAYMAMLALLFSTLCAYEASRFGWHFDEEAARRVTGRGSGWHALFLQDHGRVGVAVWSIATACGLWLAIRSAWCFLTPLPALAIDRQKLLVHRSLAGSDIPFCDLAGAELIEEEAGRWPITWQATLLKIDLSGDSQSRSLFGRKLSILKLRASHVEGGLAALQAFYAELHGRISPESQSSPITDA